MIENKKQIVILSGSPKVDQDWAVSDFLAKRGANLLRDESLNTVVIPVRHALLHRETDQAFSDTASADAIIMIFPLYFFCLPSMLTRFLQDFAASYPKSIRNANVYAIVNCGFPEPEINMEAMRVVEQFAKITGRTFSGGVMIGGGGMVLGAKSAPFMRPVFEQIDALFARVKNDLLAGESQSSAINSVSVKFPRALYFIGGNTGWKFSARKNKLKSKDLYRTPYQA
jgi:hypothetical protein